MSRKSLWERIVQWTISVGERMLVPVERFIGRRSLVGDATFFPVRELPVGRAHRGELDGHPR